MTQQHWNPYYVQIKFKNLRQALFWSSPQTRSVLFFDFGWRVASHVEIFPIKQLNQIFARGYFTNQEWQQLTSWLDQNCDLKLDNL